MYRVALSHFIGDFMPYLLGLFGKYIRKERQNPKSCSSIETYGPRMYLARQWPMTIFHIFLIGTNVSDAGRSTLSSICEHLISTSNLSLLLGTTYLFPEYVI